jgi:hypothetical protein
MRTTSPNPNCRSPVVDQHHGLKGFQLGLAA